VGAVRVATDAPKTPFRQWLIQFAGEQSPIGDLACDVRADWRWPRGPGSLARYEQHLYDEGACDGAVEALRSAWVRYERDGTMAE
jgi:hypothetical protein